MIAARCLVTTLSMRHVIRARLAGDCVHRCTTDTVYAARRGMSAVLNRRIVCPRPSYPFILRRFPPLDPRRLLCVC
jgi:hypothetical protein